ncbi:heavy-metal-associated domain-containing protein [Cetobacterium somerae]|uniref:heavy-metal-associated domain-containing protein n=1 Tax=Cetobacterium somerae TaxID=188913 RepID=UPI00211EFA9A|nr:heavy metal-associated domain-containing protein [Cetobacterium somerae]MCQ9626874.1 heavy-metal-associated domain-containing protein [Cetobacterium somerae]
MKRKVLINGMSCMNCVRHVKEALEEIPGMESVQVDLATKSAIITGDVAESLIVKVLADHDYEVLEFQQV